MPDQLHQVSWLDALPAEPLAGVLLANEVLDALPVEQFPALGRIDAGATVGALGQARPEGIFSALFGADLTAFVPGRQLEREMVGMEGLHLRAATALS